ncbi:MAG: GNAT family N-acetyltransferase [Alphaproteobacteria bacterium]
MRILKNPAEVYPYVDDARAAADADKRSLGFLPGSVYEEAAAQRKLWIAVDSLTSSYLGHLMFHGVFPTLRVTQVVCSSLARRRGIARTLVEALVEHAEKQQYTAIKARVATDLEHANRFWRSVQFCPIVRVKGGRTTKRVLNVFVRELEVPSLFSRIQEDTASQARSLPRVIEKERPTLRSRTYVIDVNVLIHAVRNAERRTEAVAVFRAAMNNKVRLHVAREFLVELQRNQGILTADPLLELAYAFPVLKPNSEERLGELVELLRSAIYPNRSQSSRRSEQDRSDLRHLAETILHNAEGFVTGDRGILNASDMLFEKWGVRIVAPSDFLEPNFGDYPDPQHTVAFTSEGDLRLKDYDELDGLQVAQFLETLGCAKNYVSAVLNPGVEGASRRRKCSFIGDQVIAFVSYDVPTKLERDFDVFLFIDEELAPCVDLIDHYLEMTCREIGAANLCRAYLHISPDQSLTREVALTRGFAESSRRSEYGENTTPLWKLVRSGAVFPEDWHGFIARFQDLTSMSLQKEMPSNSSVKLHGISLFREGDKIEIVDQFDIETYISPVLFLFSGRQGLMVPIRRMFGDELLGRTIDQGQLFPFRAALLKVEKAYFRSPTNWKLFKRGRAVVFYESGKGGGSQCAVGVGRVTYSNLVSVDEAAMNFERQGVLDEREMLTLGKGGLIHVVTFDNFQKFRKPVSLAKLREIGCVDAAQLVGPRVINWEQLSDVCRIGFA